MVGTTQRYECKACARTLARRTNSLLSLSKPPVETWTRFAGLEGRQASPAMCEEELGVSATTVHYMRLRPCEVMAAATPPAECGGGDSCQVDGTYPDESTRGLGHRGGTMPRAAHGTGRDVKVRGVSDPEACVVVGIDDDGREFARLCDRGHPADGAAGASPEGNLAGGCAAGTDGHAAYGRVPPGLGVTNHLAFPSDGSAGRGLWRVNAAHERPRSFLAPSDGVSTRYLPYHLKWWRFVELVRRARRDCLAAPRDAVARGRHGIGREGVTTEQRPFWDCWETRMTRSEVQPAWGRKTPV